MTPSPRFLLISIWIAFCCVSCGDDPKLVEKREKQRAEIATLKGEITLLEEKVRNIPPDVSGEVEKAKKHAEEQTAEVARLEEEVADLTARKRALQSEFDSYRAKYQTK